MSGDDPSVLAQRALFQPWLELPDAGWLRTALILRERIDRMVPVIPDWARDAKIPPLAPDRETEELAAANLIGDYPVPEDIGWNAQQTALLCLRNARESGLYWNWQERGTSLLRDLESEDEKRRFTRLHLHKVGDGLGDNLRPLNIECTDDGSYYYTDPAVVALYMQVLAEALRGDAKDTCIISDSRGYLGLSTMIGAQKSDEDQELFKSLIADITVDTTALLAMPSKDFIDWHKGTKKLRAGLRKKLADISTDPDNKLPNARNEFRKFAGQIPKPNTKLWKKPLRWMKSPQATPVLVILLPLIELGVDIHTAGLGTLITAPIGGGVGTIGLIRERLNSRWERYLLSMPKASSSKPSEAKDVESLIKELSAHG